MVVDNRKQTKNLVSIKNDGLILKKDKKLQATVENYLCKNLMYAF